MRTNETKLALALARIEEITTGKRGDGGWLEYINPTGVIYIDRRLVSQFGRLIPEGEWGVGGGLLHHYKKATARNGAAVENPAQQEVFIGPNRIPVYFATVSGSVYAVAEPLFPFDDDLNTAIPARPNPRQRAEARRRNEKRR
jgi:hypothetical protein